MIGFSVRWIATLPKNHRTPLQKIPCGITQKSNFFTPSTMNPEKDAEWSPSSEDEDLITPRMLRRRPADTMVESVGTNSSKRRRKSPRNTGVVASTPSRSFLLPPSLPAVTKTLEHVKKGLSGGSFDRDLSMRVKHMALMMQKDYLSEKSKRTSSQSKAVAPKIREKVCRLLALSPITYSKIMNAGKQAHETGRRGNFRSKFSRIPSTKAMVIKIRDFVRTKRENRQRVTATQVMEYLHEEGDIHS